MRIDWAVHENPAVLRNTVADPFGGHGGGHGHIAAGHGLSQAENVRGDIRPVAGKQRPGAAKARSDFIGDQQHLVMVAQLPGLPQIFGGVKSHTTGPLNNGL